jgi:hypothetical protein
LGWLPPPPRGQVAYGAPQSPTLSRFVYHMRCRRPVLPAIDDSHLRFFPHSVACCCPTHDAAARHYAARFLLSTISRYLHVICHVFPLASSSPRLLILLRTPLGWWGGGCGSSSYPHGQVTNRHAVWSSNVVHHACPSNPLCCRHLLLFNLRPSFMSSTTPISFCLLISSSPPLPRRFHPCSSPPRHLAFSPSGLRLLLALGRFGGCPPPPQKTYGQVDRASEMSPGRLRATAHIYGIGCCSPPRQPPTHLQPVDSQSVTLPLSWCSSTPQTSGHRTTRYCCMMMSFNLLSHFRLPHRPLLLHDDVI